MPTYYHFPASGSPSSTGGYMTTRSHVKTTSRAPRVLATLFVLTTILHAMYQHRFQISSLYSDVTATKAEPQTM